VKLYKVNIHELDILNQTIRDEHTALQMAFTALEDKLVLAQKENTSLLDKLISYKAKVSLVHKFIMEKKLIKTSFLRIVFIDLRTSPWLGGAQ